MYRIAADKELAVLKFLTNDQEHYALEIARESGAVCKGTVYATLHALQKKGMVSVTRIHSRYDSGTPRRLYKITKLGRDTVDVFNRIEAFQQAKP